ncbi:MAG: zinc ABC transporter substrate-binding protein [Methanomassiliicoccales archaeon]|nr:zinc ABC transporter substrate-binding protein [Methanomassiliicoccales archaeon]
MNKKQLMLVIGAVIITVLLIVASALTEDTAEDEGKVQVVATFYPLAYMAESIGGERVAVTSLVPYNTELHSWQPAPQDIIRADQSDIILYNGGPADAWLVNDVLPSIDTDDKMVVNTSVGITYISGGDDGGGGVDPHTWLSPKQALIQAKNVFDALCLADPDGADYFEQRFVVLNLTLTNLHEGYQQLASSDVSGIIVSHAAFGYVANDYGFLQYGVIGLSADEEPSAATIADLVELMRNQSIYSVFVDPVYSQNYATILKTELESKTGHDVQMLDLFLMLGPYESSDYVGQLSQNLIGLKNALGVA